MKKSVSVLILMLLIIALLVVSACFGIRGIGLKSVFDEDAIRKGLDLVGGTSITLEATMDGVVNDGSLSAPDTADETPDTSDVAAGENVDDNTDGADDETADGVANGAVDENADTTNGETADETADTPVDETTDTETANTVTDDMMDAVVAVLNQRVTAAGYTEATVTKIGDKHRVRVDIPDVADPEEAIKLVGATAQLYFIDSEGNVVLTGQQVVSAKMENQQDPTTGAVRPVVALQLDNSARQSFADATERMAQKAQGENYIAIILDDQIISMPSVSSRIDSTDCIITGPDADEAKMIANLISSGNLPCALNVVETRSVGATLGADAFTKALKAGLIGIILVMLFMIVMYQLPGFVASLALVAYIAITVLCLVGFRINLSLPGIAGIFLTIGMAVDANVIIFERIREELNGGKSVRAAVKSGFNRAFSAIIDSNVTTLIASLVLWKFGTGAIQGFAITLFMGVLISFISALFITKTLLDALVGMGVTNVKLFGAKYAENN